jgi:hypothetical protein
VSFNRVPKIRPGLGGALGAVDVYRITDQLDDATLDVLIARLEAHGKHPRFAAMLGDPSRGRSAARPTTTASLP